MIFDELHEIHDNNVRTPQTMTCICEICKEEHDVLLMGIGGPFNPIPRYNTLTLTVHDNTNGNSYHYYYQHICSKCAESILEHVKSLEVT